MKTILCIACLTIAAGPALMAGDLKKDAAVSPAVTGTSSAYVPKTTSVFTGTADDHNPFWPIGWVKMEAQPVTDTAPVLVPHTEDFAVTSILLNDPPLAVINGKDMAEGEVGVVNVNGQPVVVQLMAVRDGSVTIRWQNQTMVVPLRRDEDPALLQQKDTSVIEKDPSPLQAASSQ